MMDANRENAGPEAPQSSETGVAVRRDSECEEGSTSVTTATVTAEVDGKSDKGEETEVQFEELGRRDSITFFSPQLKDTAASVQNTSFPVTQDAVVHVPPADLTRFFDSPPRLGVYLDLIQTLLRPPPPVDESSAPQSPPSSGAPSFMTKELALDICRDVTTVFQEEPSLLQVDIESDETLVVVGDVHGQFHDMAHHVLNQQYEKPAGSKDRKFLFLGDYVDRGPQGVETVLLLFALKIEYPKQIFLIRGNHEESQTSRVYGFLFEVRTKFNDLSVWARFNEVFCYLPLAAIVAAPGHRFFAVHGGLSPSLSDVASVAEISRVDYGGMLDTTESDIVDGLLWSDPSDAVVRFSRNERGCGYLFGSAAAHEFCEQNQLDFICRAHQMTMTGYAWAHNNKVLTVFSAPNYCGVTNNLAAILTITHEWELNFIQFEMAPNRQPIAPPAASFGGFGYFQ